MTVGIRIWLFFLVLIPSILRFSHMAKIKSETANADCACIVELKHQDLKVSDQLTHCTAVLMDIVHYPMYM